MKRLIAAIIYFMLFVTAGYCELPILADQQRAEFNKEDTKKTDLESESPENISAREQGDKSADKKEDAQTHYTKVISQECAQQMADAALKERNIDVSKYDTLSVEELRWSDTKAWLIVFQLKKELRQDPKKSGGEIFVSIDQNTSEVSVTYAGSVDSYKG
ncbi:MAG: hypothetical protein ABIC68_07535 [Candidatus Omnitrophota bacterium]